MITLICIGIVIYYWREVKDDCLPIYAATCLAAVIGVELVTNLGLINALSTSIINIYKIL